MLRQTIAPLPKLLYVSMTHLAVTQSGRRLNKSTQLVSIRVGIQACASMILIREHPVL